MCYNSGQFICSLHLAVFCIDKSGDAALFLKKISNKKSPPKAEEPIEPIEGRCCFSELVCPFRRTENW